MKKKDLFMIISLIAIIVLFTTVQHFTIDHFDKKRGEEEKREKREEREERKTTEFVLTMIVVIVMILACWSFCMLVVFGLPNKQTI